MTKFLNLKMPLDLYDQIKALAKEENRSMTAQVINILKKHFQ